MTIYTEITPNPASLKFVLENALFEKGGFDFPNLESTKDAPLAAKLFELEFMKGVYLGPQFVTVTKDAAFKWEEVIPGVKNLLTSFIESGETVVNIEVTEEDNNEDDDVVAKIKRLLDENIRPAVAMDGGDVVFESFQDGVVKLKMQGACSGCPSSSMTLKMGIEGLLCRMVPEVKTVESA